ncbi:MAG: hypothetical protein AAF558_08055 [Verrucomicrobiota bacterium]
MIGAQVVAADPVIFPLDKIRPGLQAETLTVLQGTEVVSLKTEILGILEGGIGPGRDLIVAKLVDSKTELTGAVHGMSGSPVYVDGKLVGALSRRLMLFEKDGHCGITPAEYMVDVANRGRGPSGPGLVSDRTPMPTPKDFMFLPSPESRSNVLGIPMSLTGWNDSWEPLKGKWKTLFPGTLPISGGSSGKTNRELPKVKAGSPLSVVLMSGDVSMAGTGTVTWVEGEQVVGFGHPMLGLGPLQLPIAPAEIVTLVPSYLRPHKLSNTAEVCGTLYQDRLAAISGELGDVPEMATYRVHRKHQNQERPDWTGQLIKHPLLTPRLVMLLGIQALMEPQDFSETFTATIQTRLSFKDQPDLVMDGFYSGGVAARFDAVLGQMIPLAQLFAKFGKQLSLESVEYSVVSYEQGEVWSLRSLETERDEVEVGDTLKVRVRLKNDRGEEKELSMNWEPPEELRGKRVSLRCAAGSALNLDLDFSINASRIEQPADAIRYFNQSYRNNTLYLQAVSLDKGVLKRGKVQANLPVTVYRTAKESSFPQTSAVTDTVVWSQQEQRIQGMARGIVAKGITIR